MADDTPSPNHRKVVIGVILAALVGSLLMLGIVRMTDEPDVAPVSLRWLATVARDACG